MKTTQKLLAITLVLLLGGTIYGLFRTGRPNGVPQAIGKTNHAIVVQSSVVDQSPLKNAQRLSQLPVTPEEQPLAREALRVADYEIDLAFATALRDAKEHPPILSAEAQEIQARLQKSESLVETDQAQVNQLTAAVAKASGEKKDALDDDLNLAKAQLELDQDEVEDAKQDLMRAGGDAEGRIQAMVQEHETLAHNNPNALGTAAAPVEGWGLVSHFRQWFTLHEKQLQLWNAKQAADSAAASISAQHNGLDASIDQQKTSSPELAHHAKTSKNPRAVKSPVNRSREESAALVKKTKEIAGEQKTLATFDKRIDAMKDLSGLYTQWIAVVAARQRATINGGLRGVLIILVIAMILLFFDRWLEELLGRTSLDRRQVETLRTVTRVALQVAGVLLILLVIMGPPAQLGTFLGLAGAGLTVALKDFIVAFIGWLVLMGKDGIRIGDWVEINGVTGEVVQLGMFHTVLLETGNWTDSGHPTGRRVTFTNSFAIEGHYFNFSTSGQWLWDELQLVIPSGQDPYPVVAAIQKKVLETTADSARQAELEWQHAARSRDMKSLSAAPAINVKPIIGGIEIAVRYITRANERYQLRAKLYQSAVDLLGGKNISATPIPPATPAAT
jgi:small-conductance mechanosensitive channel